MRRQIAFAALRYAARVLVAGADEAVLLTACLALAEGDEVPLHEAAAAARAAINSTPNARRTHA
jgi:hypothetical protein